jgi:hypothetical protein
LCTLKGIYAFIGSLSLSFTFNLINLFFFRNLFHKSFTTNTKNLIRQIPNAISKEQVHDLLQQIEDTNDKGIKGILFIYYKNFKN